ncbi:MgtC/SapB family protein [Paenibacillus sp. 481]|uniref:MgtC/SapB family protein n=1 Tax=Paenibacillus sp. 481 TaxID=2835869 RepID=UPI001E59039F|nr:MgtC/SapB family protein [Paenibacillus sp. 481]UHA75558.1 MgtC/SapB family protein [Paenibacillus sp. 481]
MISLSVNPDVWQISYAELTIRIVIAVGLGGIIGLERELGEHAAGFRTHILVCLGSALIMMLSIYGFSAFIYEANVRMDPARLAAQVISGIGFLGAGTILRTGMTVSGLTTAASLWVVAAIGLAVGAGFYYGAILSTVTVLLSLFLLSKLEMSFSRFSKAVHIRKLTINMIDAPNHLSQVLRVFKELGMTVCDISIDEQDRRDRQNRQDNRDEQDNQDNQDEEYEQDEQMAHEGSSLTMSVHVKLKSRAKQEEKLLEALLALPFVRGLREWTTEDGAADRTDRRKLTLHGFLDPDEHDDEPLPTCKRNNPTYKKE